MDRRLPRRIIQLVVSLWMFGVSIGLILRAGLGLPPWDVLHQGLAHRFGLSIGTVVIAVGVLLLLLWVPLREKPGFGTLANTVLIGLSLNWTLSWMPAAHGLAAQIAMLVGGVVLNGIMIASYIGAGMGPGPRDGLMTGLTRVTGRSTRLVRTGIEVAALLAGWALGGTLGVGTMVYALGVGPVAHHFMPLLDARPRPAR